MVADTPVMVSFGHQTLHSFSLQEVKEEDTLEQILECFGPDSWLENNNVTVKISDSRNGCYDIFSLKNPVYLVMRILKTEILWINFTKPIATSSVPVRNAFDVLRGASEAKTLPKKIINPINEKAVLFNDIIDNMEEMDVTFPLASCDPRIKNKKTGSATQLVHDLTSIIWKIGLCENQLKNRGMWSKIPDYIIKLIKTGRKKEEPIQMNQMSSKTFATDIRDLASLALMAKSELKSCKLALLGAADVFADYSDFLRSQAESKKEKRELPLTV